MGLYRANATMTPLLIWNTVAVLAIVLLLNLASDWPAADRWGFYVPAGMIFLMGPICLAFYLIRYFKVWVTVGVQGLTLSNGTEIPWSQVSHVEARGWRPGPWNPFDGLEIGGCGWVFLILFFKIAIGLVLLVCVLWTLWTVFMPVLVLYSPWHTRVHVELADGTELIYRDLKDADEFVENVVMAIER